MTKRPPDGIEIPPVPPWPMRWRRSLRALRELLDDPEDTQKASDVFYAIGYHDCERRFRRFAASDTGRRLLAERPDLCAALSDREALLRLPEGSLGRAYLDYMDRNGYDPATLVEMERRVQARWQREEGLPIMDPLRGWYQERIMLTHDLFHVLTDYGTDHVGEATLLAFTFAQMRGRAQALVTFGAALEVFRALGPAWLRYDWAAWRRGRRASWLVACPWEELLPLRLDTARALLGVESPERAHPGGILRGRITSSREFVPI